MPQLFVDMDGVLADFDQHHIDVFGWKPVKLDKVDADGHDVDWNAVKSKKDFYLGLPPMADMQELWGYVARFNPIILTGIPSEVLEAADNKINWVRKNIGEGVEVRCCRSREKYLHAKPGDILIDDWNKYRELWINVGGVWITHTSARNSIEALRALGEEWR